MSCRNRSLAAAAALVLLAVSLHTISGQSLILTAERTNNVQLSKKGLTYVSPLCGDNSGSIEAAAGPALTCTVYWTLLLDQANSAGTSSVKLTLYNSQSVELPAGTTATGAAATYRPVAGATPLDSWVVAWNADWNKGRGVPADKTYSLQPTHPSFAHLSVHVTAPCTPLKPRTQVPFYLFASMDDSATTDGTVPVTIWAASVVQNAYSEHSTQSVTVQPPKAQYLDLACSPAKVADGDSCFYIEVVVVPTLNYTMRVSLYPATAVDALPGGFTLKAGALPAAAASGAPGPEGQFSARFGFPGSGSTLDPSVTAAAPPLAPYVFLEQDPAVPGGPSAPFSVKTAMLSAASLARTATLAATKKTTYATLSDPTGRFSLNPFRNVQIGMPGWLIALIVVFSLLLICMVVGAVWFYFKARTRRTSLQEAPRLDRFSTARGGYTYNV